MIEFGNLTLPSNFVVLSRPIMRLSSVVPESSNYVLHRVDMAQRRVKPSVIVKRQPVNQLVHCLPAIFKPLSRVPSTADGPSAISPVTCHKNKVSEQTIYSWRTHFNGLMPQDIKRLKVLETENS